MVKDIILKIHGIETNFFSRPFAKSEPSAYCVLGNFCTFQNDFLYIRVASGKDKQDSLFQDPSYMINYSLHYMLRDHLKNTSTFWILLRILIFAKILSGK